MPRFQRYIKWTEHGNDIHLKAPFNKTFNLKQRELSLGGIWSKDLAVWIFSKEKSQELKDLLFFVYGDDAHNRYDQCDLRVDIARSNPLIGDAIRGGIHFLGYTIAKASSNRSEVNLLHGMTVTAGGFASGGSVSNWKTCVFKNTSFTIRSVSYPFWQQVCERYRQEIKDGLVTMQLIERYTDRPGYEFDTFNGDEPFQKNAAHQNSPAIQDEHQNVHSDSRDTLESLLQQRESLIDQLTQVILKIRDLTKSGN